MTGPTLPETGHSDCDIHLRLLGTTDLHAHLIGYDYFADSVDETVGLTRVATLIDQARKETRNSLLFDNGDLLQGSPLGDGAAQFGGANPMVVALSVLGFDAASIGNHDFNYGITTLEHAYSTATFPVLCGNVEGLSFPPYALLRRRFADTNGTTRNLCVGVVGFTPPQILKWDAAKLSGRVEVSDIPATARALVPQMRSQGADIIVALLHGGIEDRTTPSMHENPAIALAEVDGIDAIFTGHTHQVFPGPDFAASARIDPERGRIAGKPGVMAGAYGSHLGLVDLDIQCRGGVWSIKSSRVEARPIGHNTPEHPRIRALAEPTHDATLKQIALPLGFTKAPIQSHFSLVSDTLALRLVQRAQAAFVRDALQGTPHGNLPVLAAAAPFRAGGKPGPEHYTDIPVGALSRRSAADLYSFPNHISAVRVTGAQVRHWLEGSARLFNQIPEGAVDVLLIDPEGASYNFDCFDGVTYRIDPTRDPGDRIRDLRFRGEPMSSSANFVVATNSYRSGGGGDILQPETTDVVWDSPDTIRDILARYLRKSSPVTELTDPGWQIVLPIGTSVTLHTGKGALPPANIPDLRFENLDPEPDGFQKWRVTGIANP